MSSVRWPRYLSPRQLCQILRRQKNPLKALRLLDAAVSKFPYYHHNFPVFATIIDMLLSSTDHHLSHLPSLLRRLRTQPFPCRDSVFSASIACYASAGHLSLAVALYRSLPLFNCPDFTHSFHTLLRILLSRRHLSAALHLFVQSSRWPQVRICTHSINLLIDALCRHHRRSDLALRLFAEMGQLCCQPDRQTYSILMKGLCAEGRLEDAKHLLHSMFWMISQKGSGADVAIYRILLEALCDKGAFQEAGGVLTTVLKKALKTPKRVPDFVAEFASRASVEDVKRLINQALVRGGVKSLAGYTAMVEDLYLEERIEDANQLFDEMRDRGFTPSISTYHLKIEALCGQGRAIDGAKVLDEEMVACNCVPAVRTYNSVMEGLCKEGKSMKAIEYLEKMAGQVGCVADGRSYEILVVGLCREGQFVEASRILEQMLARMHWPSAGMFNMVVLGLCKMDRMYEAVLWLEEMVSLGMMPETYVWNSLVVCACSDMAGAEASVGILRQLIVAEH